MRTLKKVIVFRSDLLPRSETFIKEQAKALRDWRPVLAGYRTVPGGLDISGLDTAILPGLDRGTVGMLYLRYCQWRGMPHPPTVHALRDLDAKLVHAHFGTNAVDIWPSAREAGLSMVVTLHGYDINIHRQWWEAGNGGMRRRNYPTQLLALGNEPAVHFIAVSKAIKRRAVAFGLPEEKITVAYIGVDTDRFSPGSIPITERPKRILFVGRMVESKAPLLMIRAYAEVRKAVPDAELVMIGDGALLGAAKDLARQANVPAEFLGARSSEEVIQQMHQARLLCLPSVETGRGDAEGFGLVLIEAQACGVPVVTSALGGTTEGIVHGKTGLAFKPGNAEQLAHALTKLLNDPRRTETMSSSALHFARDQFSVTRLARALQGTYDALACASVSP